MSPIDRSQEVSSRIGIISLCITAARRWRLGLVVAATVSCSYVVGTYLYLDKAKSSRPLGLVANISFKGGDAGTFPNGVPYHHQDIVSESVVAAVYKRAPLNLPYAELQRRLRVEPFTPSYSRVMASYSNRLAGQSGTDQIALLQQGKQRELAQLRRGSVILSLDVVDTGVTRTEAEGFLQNILSEWNRQSIEEKGVMLPSLALATERQLDESLFLNVDYTVLSDLFSNKVVKLRQNIRKLAELEGVTDLVDLDTGLTLSDVEARLKDLELYVINDTVSPVESLGISRNAQLSEYYYIQKLLQLQDQAGFLREKRRLLQEAYEAHQVVGLGQGEDAPLKRDGPSLPYPPSLSLDSAALEALMATIAADPSDLYLQGLNQRWLEVGLEIAEVNSRIRKTKALINSLGAVSDGVAVRDGGAFRDEYLAELNQALPSIIGQLRGYYQVVERLYLSVGQQNLADSGGALYKAAGGIRSVGRVFEPIKILSGYVLTMLLTGLLFLVVVACRVGPKPGARAR